MSSEPNSARVERRSYTLAPTDVGFSACWLEWLLLLASVSTPILVSLVYHNAELFARSGALTVFFAAAAEFVTLNRSNRKHLLNACRAKDHETPRDFSLATKVIGWLSFLFGLTGTIVWAYRDKFYGT